MFRSLKEKFWGKEIYGFDVGADTQGRNARVILWQRGDEIKLQIKSEAFSHAQAPGANWGKVEFEPARIERLLCGIQRASSELDQLTAAGRS
ncbi:MAG: hypothetical protein AAF441_10745 [Pseudomonadota bacterium]